MTFPAPPDHLGQKMLMVSHRDLLLIQIQSWTSGYEAFQEMACRARPEMKDGQEACSAIRVEPEAGTDSETIRFHAYYPVTGTKVKDDISNASAGLDMAVFKSQFKAISPEWLKWERRDNGGSIEILK